MSSTNCRKYEISPKLEKGKEYDLAKGFSKVKDDLDNVKIGLFEECILSPQHGNFPQKLKDLIAGTGELYICNTCDHCLRKKNKMPDQCVMNGLEIDDAHPVLKDLNDLEKTLVGKRVIFMKIFKMPNSRWDKTIDKCVNVPICDNALLKTLNKLCPLPRNPDDAGLVQVQLKRKLEYKNTVIKAYVRGDVLVEAVKILKKNHPGYATVPVNNRFDVLEEEDDDDVSDMECDTEYDSQRSQEEKDDNEHIIDKDEEKEKDHQEAVHDSIRSQQFDLGGQTCMTDLYPETAVETVLSEDSYKNNSTNIAPGEGKIPINLLRDLNFDTEGFPVLHPRGRFGLNYEKRNKPITKQKYFTQRLPNINPIFTDDKSYVFTALNCIEMESLERNINISYQRGKVVNGTLENFENVCSMFDNIPGSFRYWQKRRYEVLAKLEQLGAFQFFFTLSCADKRWDENFVSILRLRGIRVDYKPIEKKGCTGTDYSYEAYEIYVKGKNGDVPLKDYLKDENLHEMVRENVLNITMNFDKRVHAFMKNIVMADSSPMHAKFFHYRVEFQLRGAGHIHGVLWVDVPTLEKKDTKLEGLQEIMTKLRTSTPLNDKDKNTTAHFVDKFVTCSLTDYKDLTERVKEVQTHSHSGNPKKKTGCYKKGSSCRFGYPRFPSEQTIIAQPLKKKDNENDKEFEDRKHKMKEILTKVKRILEDLKADELNDVEIKDILKKANVNKAQYDEALASSNTGSCVILKRKPAEIYINNYNPEWLKAWDGNMDLAVCLDFFAIITYITDYYTKLESEMMAKLLDAAKACKGRERKEQMKFLAQAFMTSRQTGEFEAYYRIFPHLHLSESNLKCKFVATGFPSNRSQFARKVRDNDGKPINEDDEGENKAENEESPQNMIYIPGREGTYQRKVTDHEKYAARPSSLEKMCLAQFIADYDQEYGKKDDGKFVEDIPECECQGTCKCRRVIHKHEERQNILPPRIKLTKGLGYMKKRKEPAILRYHKQREDKNPHEHMYSQLLLWYNWRSESELFENDYEKCEQILQSCAEHIRQVQEQLFPNRKAVEEGRAILENFADPRPSHIGDTLDPENEQANEEAAREGLVEDDEFAGRYPREEYDNEDSGFAPEKSIYKPVAIPIDSEQLKKMHQSVENLDKDQRPVFDRLIEFVKKDRTSSHSNMKRPDPPLIKVHGGAGCGKSFLINVLTQVCEYWMTFGNKHPDKPSVLKLAPTGKSANVIDGHTLHTGLKVGFGNQHTSLPDRLRETMRNELSDLSVVIIDEMSMVKSDILYQLFLRLQEIKQNKQDFGGVAILLFGDLLQLKPVQAKWIFEPPHGERFKASYAFRSLWDMFESYELSFNHRQGEDKEYGDLLNRLRWLPALTTDEKKELKGLSPEEKTKRDNRLSEEDKKLLASRVTDEKPENAIYVFGKTVPVRDFNEKKLGRLKGDTEVMEAMNRNSYQKNFTPKVEKSGIVHNTPLMQTLKMKKGAKTMITYNLDTPDGLTNGTTGTVVGFEKQNGKVVSVLVNLDDQKNGKALRLRFAQKCTCLGAPNAVPIGRVSFEYNLGSSEKEHTAKAKCIQFPLTLAWAVTCHKCQGATIEAPTCLVADFESCWGSAMGYVMLGRIQKLSQLYLPTLDTTKIYANEKALEEAHKIKLAAQERIANMETDKWKLESRDALQLISLNIQV